MLTRTYILNFLVFLQSYLFFGGFILYIAGIIITFSKNKSLKFLIIISIIAFLMIMISLIIPVYIISNYKNELEMGLEYLRNNELWIQKFFTKLGIEMEIIK